MPRLATAAATVAMIVSHVLWAMSLGACPKDQENPGSASEPGSTGPGATSTGDPGTIGTPTTGPQAPGTGDTGGPPTTSVGTTGSTTGGGGSSSSGGGEAETTPVDATTTTGETGATSTGEHTTGEPPVLADCFDCTCDIHVSFCRKVFQGVIPFAGPDPPMCPIVEAESLDSGCVLYPPRCGDAPSCACLPKMDGGCFCNEVRPGNFQVVCPLP